MKIAITFLIGAVSSLKVNEPFVSHAQIQTTVHVAQSLEMNKVKGFASKFHHELQEAQKAVELARQAQQQSNAEKHHSSFLSSGSQTGDYHDLDITSGMLGQPVSDKINAKAPAKAPPSTQKVAPSKKIQNLPEPAAATPADPATPAAPAAPAAPATDAASASPPSNSTASPSGTGAANGTIPASGTNSSANGTAADAGDAEEIAAASDAEKAAMLTKYAKQKVNDLVSNLKALDTHVKDQFAALETILNNVEISAEFDPESAEDIAWITAEITKILDDTPQIAALEDKLGMVKDTDPVLKTVIDNLKKVTNVSTMLDLKKKNEAASAPSGAALKKKNKTVNASNSTNATTSANATTPATAPASPAEETAPAPATAPAAAPAEPVAADAALHQKTAPQVAKK